jgi:hypothetical protein
MPQPTTSIINFSSLTDDQALIAIRAVNRQIAEDFVPIWGNGRTLSLHAASFDPMQPDTLAEEPVRGDSVLYMVNESTLPGALGYHDMNTAGIPVGFVFVLDQNDWTITLSHEALELIIDPTVNLMVPGPDPRDPANWVLHAYEACDAVERMSYSIDGVAVSDFLTPNYFTLGDEKGTRNDFLGVGVKSFGVTPNSHISFFDLSTGTWETVFGAESPAVARLAQRAQRHDHPKPRRPAEPELMSILERHRKSKRAGMTGLPQLQAITRSGRYRALASRMTTAKGRAKAATAGSSSGSSSGRVSS